jgi:hypothetical protein
MSSKLSKPKISEVHAFLRKHNGLIVHFSGAPKGAGKERGPAHLFPADLQHVIERRAMGGLSCSVVCPGDTFHGFERNATGAIGVVLDLSTDASLVAAHPHDCGSREDEHGNRIVPNERDISPDDLERTLRDRPIGDYNEWVLRDYQVCGIFAMPPYEVSNLQDPEYPEDTPAYLRSTDKVPGFRVVNFEELVNTFHHPPIYTFRGAEIFRCTPEGLLRVEHHTIYK